jgi:ubiquinone/menaquinone biosynthesis C-methylase UbiE
MPAEEMKIFYPSAPTGDSSYDQVAALYDEAFADIKVRKDEWEWLNSHLPKTEDLSVLDIGCGNGALLNALSERIKFGAGVDESEAILEKARQRNAARANLEFKKISSPHLPFNDASFDAVISLMSFRYLDWDPLLTEVKRVMKPGGTFLIVDMVTDPVRRSEYPHLLRDKLHTLFRQQTNAALKMNLERLVSHPHWKKMLNTIPFVPSTK